MMSKKDRNNNSQGNHMSESEDRSRFNFVREGEDDRVSHEVESRSHGSFYEFPDFDQMDFSNHDRPFNLIAPPPRVDARWGKMQQYWANKHMNNGRRIYDLMQQGWRPRNPATVDQQYSMNSTVQWQSNDVIEVANTHILMEIPVSVYQKIQRTKFEKNHQRMRDIERTHGSINRDGEYIDRRLDNVGAFTRQVTVNRRGGDMDDIHFAE